jgi:chromosome segregation ATPase
MGILPWIVGLEVVIVAFALVMRLRRGPELAVPVPVEKLREFVGLYDERLALTRELVIMEEEVGRGGLVKHEFRRRSKVMELRLDELNKSLMEVKAELRAISQRYEELIRRIDRAETEIEGSRASLNQVRGQYRAGKTTRETYDTVTNDISKRIDKAEETVETTLITLREEAR